MKVVQGAAWARLRLSSGADGRAGTPNTADEPSTQELFERFDKSDDPRYRIAYESQQTLMARWLTVS